MGSRPTALRICLSLFVGAAIFAISFAAAWHTASVWPSFAHQSFFTGRLLMEVRDAVEAYRAKEGKLPQSLAQLKETSELYIDETGSVNDEWYHPLRYEVHGETYLVISYGRDGRPGGAGLDADITSDHPQWPGPTLRQFLWEMPTRGLIKTCILSGLVAAVLTFLTVRSRPAGPNGIVGLAVKILIISGATLFMASIISVLHIPSGH